MRFDIDAEADAAYLQLKSTRIVETRQIGDINVDLDAAGQVVGVEVLHLPKLSAVLDEEDR